MRARLRVMGYYRAPLRQRGAVTTCTFPEMAHPKHLELLQQGVEREAMSSRRRFIALSSTTALWIGLAFNPSLSQANILTRNARMMVGFPAGSAPDFIARLLVENVKGYAPSMIVDNRPGAGGRLPLEALKGGERDGTVIALTPGYQLTLFPHIYTKLGYDALRDFAPGSTVCTVQYLLVVGPLVPAEVMTVTDFVAWCRANPKLAYLRVTRGGNASALHGSEFGARRWSGNDARTIQRCAAPDAGSAGWSDRRERQRSF
jgi:tripartite-type tricarboxylate transporter receptor subunit TctC